MIDGKPATSEKTVYVCGSCKSSHDKKDEANKCCICSKCNKAPVREARGWYRGSLCKRCHLKEQIRYQQGEVRRHTESLASAKKSLEELQQKKATLDAAQVTSTEWKAS